VASANVERVRDAFERWNAGDRELRPEEVHPDIVLETVLASSRGKPYRGHEGFRRWLADIDEQFDRWTLRMAEVEEVSEDRVLVLGSIHLRGRASGVEFEQPFGWVFDFRDGMTIRMATFTDPAEARAAAALSG
jgi:ketosteroid isomerase-like protein